MTDTLSKEVRSRNMAAVRSRNTGPEVMLRREVWRRGLRFFTPRGWKRLSGTQIAGSPDVIFPASRLAVFVDGCFWHGCPVHYTEPEDNREFWQKKLQTNRNRDQKVNEQLRAEGWTVLRLWEHELRKDGLRIAADRIEEIVYKGEDA